MKGIVDRLEGRFVVVEVDGGIRDVEKDQIVGVVSAGDVLVYRDGKWHKDAAATKERTQYMKKLMDSVWED